MIEQVLPARPGLQAVDRRIKPLLDQRSIEMQLHVACSLEFFKNDLVHLASRIDQSGGQDCQAAAFLAIARRAKKLLGLQERLRLNAAGHRPALAWLK